MTRAPTDAQVARLEAAARKASERLAAAQERRIEEISKVYAKHRPREWAAEVAARNARTALELAKMARLGITPLVTVVQWQGALWAVRINPRGCPVLVPLKRDLTEHKGRNEMNAPYRMEKVSVVVGKVARL